jgi:hypothetical protein
MLNITEKKRVYNVGEDVHDTFDKEKIIVCFSCVN